MDPDIDFGSIFERFEALLIGRKTFAAMHAMGGGAGDMAPGVKSIIVSRTMRQTDHPDLTLVNDAESFVTELKSQTDKDIWLFGGGELFHSLLTAGLVDGVDVAVSPVLLGGGIPLLSAPAPRASLVLRAIASTRKPALSAWSTMSSSPVDLDGAPPNHLPGRVLCQLCGHDNHVDAGNGTGRCRAVPKLVKL